MYKVLLNCKQNFLKRKRYELCSRVSVAAKLLSAATKNEDLEIPEFNVCDENDSDDDENNQNSEGDESSESDESSCS